MSILVDQIVFAAGVISRALWGRRDLARRQAGLKALTNALVMIEGGITRRPGTRYAGALRTESQRGKMIPFEFSTGDAYQIVLSGGFMRLQRAAGVVETAPGVPFELAVPFAEDELEDLRWSQQFDLVFLARGRTRRPYVIKRLAATDWEVKPYDNLNGPLEPQNLDQARTISASGQTGTVTLTASTDTFLPGHVGSTWRLEESNLADVPLWKGNEEGLTPGTLRRNAGKVYSVVSGSDAGPNAPTHEEGQVASGQGNVVWQFEHGGGGYVRITAVAGPRSATAACLTKLPTNVVTPRATYRWYEAAWSDQRGWPDVVRAHDNRLLWMRGDTGWLTKIGDFYDFDFTETDTGAVPFRLTSPDGKLVEARWCANSGAIVVGASHSEWMVRGSQPFDTITSESIRAVPDGTEGSAPHIPAYVDGGALYIGRSRKRLHYALFDRIAERVQSEDVTTFSRQVLRARAMQVVYQRDPDRIAWIRLDNGKLAALTFRPDQQIYGWSLHETVNGFIEDLSVIYAADGISSELWLIVRRQIDGQTRRYVEVLQPPFEPPEDQATAAGAWFLDCGLSYAGAPVSAVTGGQHLAGQTVRIFADGIDRGTAVMPASGTLVLPAPASAVAIGLPIGWRIRTLPMDAQLQSGSTAGSFKKANQVLLELSQAFGGRLSVNDGRSEPLFATGQLAPDVAPALFDGPKWITPAAPIGPTLEVELSGDEAYPFTLQGISPALIAMEGR